MLSDYLLKRLQKESRMHWYKNEHLFGRKKAYLRSWLDNYSFKHVRLYEHTDENPQVHKLTKEHLDKVAQQADLFIHTLV